MKKQIVECKLEKVFLFGLPTPIPGFFVAHLLHESGKILFTHSSNLMEDAKNWLWYHHKSDIDKYQLIDISEEIVMNNIKGGGLSALPEDFREAFKKNMQTKGKGI